MPNSWFQRNDTNNEGSQTQQPVFTDEHFERIATETAKKMEGSVTTSLGTQIASALAANPILVRLKETMDANAARQTQQQQRTQTDAQRTQQTEFQTAYDELDPSIRTVVDARFNQANQTALRAESRETRRSIFEDVDNFPYYTGDLRAKVDELIDKENLDAQVNPMLIRNAYKIVVADHMKEIQEGKVRSRLSAASGSSTSTNGVAAADPNALPVLSDEEKKQARNFGIKEEDWARTKKDLLTEGVIGV